MRTGTVKSACLPFLVLQAGLAIASVPALVPQPQQVEWREGFCPLETAMEEVSDKTIPAEGYRLDVSPARIVVFSSDSAGAFYARQTLKQLEERVNGTNVVRCCRIVDAPAYRWRGVLIDEGRHFLGKETVLRLIDVMAFHKFNRLHWHLTEDQGWRLDVPGLPELVKYGSQRPCSPRHGPFTGGLAEKRDCNALNDCAYGPFFYTREDLEDVVRYATAHHVQIVPEIELPGHSRGALAAYPDLACFPEHIVPRTAYWKWGVTDDVLCAGNDDTLKFLEKVLDYVCDVFPSEVIHIGGDECRRTSWKKCPKCQKRMKDEGLKEEGQLQAWITSRVADYLAKKGRRIMGWDEILAGDVPKTAIGQSWRKRAKEGVGTEHVSAGGAVERGFDIVVSTHSETYYNYDPRLKEDPFEYDGGNLPLSRAYAFDPMCGIPESGRPHVLGAEACAWGELIWNEYDLAWKLWPRACAMAEILWTNPHTRDFAEFRARLAIHRRRLLGMKVNCQPLD